ncbi:MAG: hypothetical protein PF445_06400, partial [Melioribacteraceae bacterium]|nr:hypothetical protein [Melioribacteraceae bacterium]
IDNIKHRLIDRILITKNEKLLEAIETIFVSTQKKEEIQLSLEQIEMLAMSEEDIKNNRLVSESELKNIDAKWSS